jgi:ketosteroid isomerase-like protein
MTEVIEAYWAAAEARDWAAFGALLAEDVRYELPQTRECVRGREAYVRFNAEYPGDWHLAVERAYADRRGGASLIAFTVGGETQHAATFFRFDGAGRIAHITDFWPEPYEPPAGREHLVERY